MKTVLAAGALAATLLAGSALPSFAATYDLGTFTDSDTRGLNPAKVKNSFTDFYTFDLATFATVTAASVTNSFANASQFITNFVVKIYSGTITGSNTLLATSAPATAVIPGFEATGTSANSLGSGEYFLKVTGSTSKTGATYGGSLAVSAVPLPNSVALFGVAVAGLGVAGAMRRKARASAA